MDPARLHIPDDVMGQWQGIVDIIASLAGIPAGLIMRLTAEDIEVFVSSHSRGNPYRVGAHEHLDGSGLYCETVIKTRRPLLVPDALADPDWRDNPDVKLRMISYLGFPILLPDRTPFGTLCILDNKKNAYTETINQLLEKFRDMIQMHLALLFMNDSLGEKNKQLTDYLEELTTLRGLIPICVCCKKIKDDKGYWHNVEEYLLKHPSADFTHGYCPECYQKAVQDLECT